MQSNSSAPVPALLPAQIAEPPQCGVLQSAYNAWPWQPLAVLLPPLTFELRSPGAAAAAAALSFFWYTLYMVLRWGLGARGGEWWESL